MKIQHVACYGSGVIGSGWATNFLMAGLSVSVFDVDNQRLEAAKKQVEENLNFLVTEQVLDAEEITRLLNKIVYTTDPASAVATADLIQENGPENLVVKQNIVAVIEGHCRADAIIASSTSGLLISDICAKAVHPERFVGAHPYNPVHLLPLVEMTRCEKTDPAILQNAYDFYKSMRKEPIILQKEALGFICNRLQVALLREATDLVHRGVCSIDEIDRAVCYGPGLRLGLMGPHAIFQLTGGPYGIAGALKHIGAAMPTWLRDMATWTEFPGMYADPALVQEKTNEALALRPVEQGQDSAGLAAFRDKGLVYLLKFHGKL